MWCTAHTRTVQSQGLPEWCRRRWTPRSLPPRWRLAGTAGTLRCCHRRSSPTWRLWQYWWSCRRSGWCQTPPLPHLCQQFPDRKQRDDQKRTSISWGRVSCLVFLISLTVNNSLKRTWTSKELILLTCSVHPNSDIYFYSLALSSSVWK